MSQTRTVTSFILTDTNKNILLTTSHKGVERVYRESPCRFFCLLNVSPGVFVRQTPRNIHESSDRRFWGGSTGFSTFCGAGLPARSYEGGSTAFTEIGSAGFSTFCGKALAGGSEALKRPLPAHVQPSSAPERHGLPSTAPLHPPLQQPGALIVTDLIPYEKAGDGQKSRRNCANKQGFWRNTTSSFLTAGSLVKGWLARNRPSWRFSV